MYVPAIEPKGVAGIFSIKDKENGILSDPNAEDFAKQLSWVADNPQLADEIGRKGKELAFNAFSYKTQSEAALSTIDRYYKALGGGKL